MKKIIISGGTGMIGSALIRKFDALGWKSHAISRDPPRKKFNFQKGVEKYILFDDFLSGENFTIDDYEVVVNLAGASLADQKWTDGYKEKIIKSRTDTTSAFSEHILNSDNPPSVFISGSAVGYYGNTGNALVKEDSNPGDDFLAEVCKKWEQEALKAENAARTVLCRIGLVLDKNEGALDKLTTPFKLFVGGSIGSGEQWMSWIHIEDLTDLIVFFIENDECMGAFNCTAPNPVKMKHFAEDLGDALYRPSIFKVPSFALKMLLGESASMLLVSQRVVPEKALEKGFEFRFPELKPALIDLLREPNPEDLQPKPIPK